MKSLFIKIIGILLICSPFLSANLVSAQDSGDSFWDNYDFTQGDNVGTPAGAPGNPPPSPDERMKELTKDDQPCEAQAGLGVMNNLVNKAGSLPNLMAQSFQEQLPQTLESFMTDQLPQIAQRQLQTVLPQLIQTGLRNQLPSFVNSAIRDLVRQGFSSADIEEALPGIVDQSVNQIIPNIIENQLPEMIGQGIEDEMPSYLAERCQSQLPGIINQESFRRRVAEMVDTVIGNIRKTQLNTNISNADQQGIEQGVIDNILSTASSSLSTDPNLDKISRNSAPVMSQLASGKLRTLLAPFMGSCNKGASDAIKNSFNTTLNGLTGRGYDLTGGLSGEFFNPIAASLQAPLGNWAYSTVSGITPGLTFAPSDLVGGEAAFQSLGVDPANIGAANAAAANAGTAITSNAGNIGLNSISSETWSNLGNSLGTSLANGVGGMVGSLVGNIPVVGGLLAPLADTVATAAMEALLGIPTAILGWPVADEGLQLEMKFGLGQLGKIENQIAQNTAKTNNQNDQMIKQDGDRNNLIQQACTHELATKNATLNLEKLFFILVGDAAKARWLGLVDRYNAFRQFMQTAYQMPNAPVGTDGQPQGQPLIQPWEKVVQDDIKQRQSEELQNAKDSGWTGEEAVKTLVRDQNKPGGPTITQEQWNKIRDPEQAQQLAQESTFWSFLGTIYEPWNNNNPSTAAINTRGKQLIASGEAEKYAMAKLQANGGVPDIRTCNVPLKTGPDGKQYCPSGSTWLTMAPGSVILSYLNSLNSGVINMITNNPNHQSDFINNVPNDYTNQISSLGGNPNTNTVAQQQNSVGSDPCPGTEPCPKSGWQAGQMDVSAMSDTLQSGIDSAFGGSSNWSGGSGSGFDFSDFQLPESDTMPTINYFRLSEDKTMLEWWSNFVYQCNAKNDWTGTNFKTGDILGANGGIIGNAEIDLPATHQQLNYTIECLGPNDEPISKELIIPANQ